MSSWQWCFVGPKAKLSFYVYCLQLSDEYLNIFARTVSVLKLDRQAFFHFAIADIPSASQSCKKQTSLFFQTSRIVCAKTKCSLFFLCIRVSFLWVSARNDGKVLIVSHSGGYYIARTFSWSVPPRFPSRQSAQLVGSQGPKSKDLKNIVLCLKLSRKKCLCTTKLRTAESSRATRTCCRNGRGLGASATRQLNFVITAVFIVHESCKKTDGKDSKSWSKRLHSVMHALIAFRGTQSSHVFFELGSSTCPVGYREHAELLFLSPFLPIVGASGQRPRRPAPKE